MIPRAGLRPRAIRFAGASHARVLQAARASRRTPVARQGEPHVSRSWPSARNVETTFVGMKRTSEIRNVNQKYETNFGNAKRVLEIRNESQKCETDFGSSKR